MQIHNEPDATALNDDGSMNKHNTSHSMGAFPETLFLKRHFAWPNPPGLFGAVLAALAIRGGLLTASRTIDTIQLFLFTSPTSPSASPRLAAATRGVAFALMESFCVFSLAALVALAANKTYFVLRLRGIWMVLTAYGCWLLAAFGLVFWVKGRDKPGMPFAYSILAALLGFALARKGSIIFGNAKQHMLRSADDVLENARRSPILYLRSFKTDTHSAPENYSLESGERSLLTWRVLNPAFWTERREWSFEEVLCEGLSYVSPVIAMGQPGERLPKLGAARKYVKGPDWQPEVIRLLNACRFACFVLGSSQGLLWELQQAVSYCPPQRVLLIIPPHCGRQMAWDAFVEEVRKAGIAMALPSTLPEATLAVVFADQWQPIVVSGRPVVGNYRELGRRVAASAWHGRDTQQRVPQGC